jgi:hypothetical protein
LRRRGLDPERAADLGAGYAPPNTWPGDRGRKVGRLVYPLANPLTGQVVSALGRLCVDAEQTWSAEVQAAFKAAKQRKLAGCPAGVWPYARIALALQHYLPLVLVEGPADALALLQAATAPLAVVALLGTANILPVSLLQQLPGVVAALDADGPGARAMRQLQADCAIAGVPVETPPRDWLDAEGQADPGDLPACLAHARTDQEKLAAQHAYAAAVSIVELACDRLAGVGRDLSGSSNGP